jgi:sorbitol/mannitol transport system substrate-binding protein
VLASATLSGCAFGWGGGVGGGGADTINVLMVNNPQMVDLQKLTKEHFTAKSGIEVKYTVLPENDVRDKISQEFSSQAGTYDVASLSNFEIPIYADSGWVAPLDEYIEQTPDFDQDDILGPMAESLKGEDGKIYGEPFYGESSFLMYRKDVLEAEGIEMPEKPTWPEVAEIAAQVDGAEDGMAGICLRGQPGWGQIFGPLTTVVNTFGGTVVHRGLGGAGQRRGLPGGDAVLRRPRPGARRAGRRPGGLHRVPQQLPAGQRGHVVRRDLRCRVVGGGDSPVKGKVGYAPAPVVETDSSGWLYAWSWAIQDASQKKDQAWEFMAWASSKEYEELVGEELSWAQVPAGKRASTYENPDYLAEAEAVRRADAPGHRVRRPDRPRRPAPTREGHPVRRHPRLPGRRHPGLAARQLGHRRQDDRRRGAGPGAGAGGGRRGHLPRTGSAMSRHARRPVSRERTRS